MARQSSYPAWVELGTGAQIDDAVILGYQPGRPLADQTLRIGEG